MTMNRTILITGANNGIGLALEYTSQGIIFNVMHPPLTCINSAAGFGIPPEMMADPQVVGRELARLVGKTRPMLAVGFVNNLQLWMSYHLRVPMGRLMSSLAEKARQSQKGNTIVTSERRN